MRKKSMAVAVAIALTAGTVMPQMTLADSFAQEDVQELEVQADFSEGETADDSGFEIEEADGDENAPDVEVDGETDSEEDNAGSEEQQEGLQTFSSEEESGLDDGSLKPEDAFSDGDTDEELNLAGEISADAVRGGFQTSANGESDNRNQQDYSTGSAPSYSYLTVEQDGYYRVEYVDDKLLIEKYSTDFTRQFSKKLDSELELFGGFYAGKDAYYIAWGQMNWDEEDSKEVIRLIKYDKNWNRIGAASLKGANTTAPFSAGNLRMAEYGNVLYIRTSHGMYTTDDGLNHQANLTWQVRTSDMTSIDSCHEITNQTEGYVSHSFNQFILIDDQANIVALDHGDAYPRGALLGMYEKTASENSFRGDYFADLVWVAQGEEGVNYTGMSLGGLEYSNSSYLTAGNSVIQDANWSDHNTRNIFITVTSRSDCTKTPVEEQISEDSYTISYPLTLKGTTSSKWITSYSESSGISASTPELVKLSSDAFVLLWAQTNGHGESNGKISYVFLDGRGNTTSSIYTKNGYLSDCQPVVSGGKAIWYVTDGSKMTICRIGSDGSFETEPAHKNSYEPEMKFDSNEITCGLVDGTAWNPFSTNSDGKVSYSSSDESIAKVDANGKVSLLSTGTCKITAHVSAGINYAAKSVSYTLHVLDLKKQTIHGKNSFKCAYGDSKFNLGMTCEGNAVLTYKNDTPNVVSVSSKGEVTVKAVGTATIHVIATATDTYSRGALDIKITVSKKDISKTQLIFTKIGPVKRDDVYQNIAVIDGDRILEEETDYFNWGGSYYYGYQDDYLLEIGQDIEGVGNYTGEAELYASPINERSKMNSAKFTSKGNQLSWQEESGAVGYYIYRKVNNDSTYKRIKKITRSNITSWTDTEYAGTMGTYTYCVRAYTRNGDKELLAKTSNAVTCSPQPVLKSAVSQNGNAVKVTWEPLKGVDSYILYYRKNGSSWKEAARNIKDASYTHTKLTLGDQYTYTVRGVVGNQKTDYNKNGVSAYVVPAAVKLGKVTSSGYDRVKLTWTKMNGAAGYVIYIKQNGKWTKLATTTNTSYIHINSKKFPVVTGRGNTYTVRAMCRKNNKTLYGSYSNTGITGKAMPARTAISSLNPSKNALAVSYKKVAGASGYQIAYSLYKDKGYRYVTVSGNRLSTTLKNLASKKNYFVKVRAYRTVNKKRYYGAYSPVKYKKTK